MKTQLIIFSQIHTNRYVDEYIIALYEYYK